MRRQIERHLLAAILIVAGASSIGVASAPARAEPVATAIPPGAGDILREIPDNLFGIALGPHGAAVATGYHGTVKFSSDGGAHWSRISAATNGLLRRVAMTADQSIFAVSSNGEILKQRAGQNTWQVVHSEDGLYLRDIAFADAQTGWAVGHEGLILHTTDGGATWQRQELKDWTGHDRPRLSGIAVIDANRAVVVGEFGTVARTDDGGGTWSLVSTNTLPTLLAVAMHGDNGFAVGVNGAVVRLSHALDGPMTATAVNTGATQHLLAVALSDDGETALIGGRGTLRVYRDGKLTAVPIGPGTTLDDTTGRADVGNLRLGTYLGPALADTFIAGVAVDNDGRAMAVGQGGLILASSKISGPYEAIRSLTATSEKYIENETPLFFGGWGGP